MTIPIPSPASGFLYNFDSGLGVYSRSGQSFGPIFAERAETIGKNKFLAGVSYQHFNFDRLDGLNIKKIPALFQHQPATNLEFQKDVITTENAFDIQVGQTVAYFTYGLSDRLDVSVAVPMASASIEIVSDATIRRIGTSNEPEVHYFDSPFPTRDRQSFSASGSASGIGDVLVRAKYTAIRWKMAPLPPASTPACPPAMNTISSAPAPLALAPFSPFPPAAATSPPTSTSPISGTATRYSPGISRTA